MKRLFLLITAAMVVTACNANSNATSSSLLDDVTEPGAWSAYVTCGEAMTIEKGAGDNTFRVILSDRAKIDQALAEGWLAEDDLTDGVLIKALEKRRNDYYRFFASASVVGETYVEFRWDEGSNPPRYASLGLWETVTADGHAPYVHWNYSDDTVCQFEEVDGNFDLPPPPPPQPTLEADANHCEYYVNSLGTERYHYTGGGYDELFVVAYLSVDMLSLVDAQGSEITQVGMRLNGRDDVTTTQEFEPGYFKLSKSLWLRGHRTSDYDLQHFAFFIDVKRVNGEVARLWLKNGAWDFNWPEVFDNYPKHRVTQGPHAREYVLDPSPIYNQKNICQN